MHIDNILIENSGPISKLNIKLPFSENYHPQPLVIVGKNGSGKTIALSSIIDSLHEIADLAFSDINPKEGLGHKYYKLLGSTNQTEGTNYSLTHINFHLDDSTHINYLEKTGNITKEEAQQKLGNFISLENWDKENFKSIIGAEEKLIELKEFFKKGAICSFPVNRYEKPHWLNEWKGKEEFTSRSIFSEQLGKSINIDTTSNYTKSWLLDVMLDARMGVHEGKAVLLEHSLNKLLSLIYDGGVDIIFARGNRSSQYKLAIGTKQPEANVKALIKSIDHLSFGQATLLSMFTTIIRYIDLYNPQESYDFSNARGIVVIDEIDAHLHIDLQNIVLPKLIQLFPKIQFILTAHSPFFLLGMRETFGDDGFQIIEMPTGEIIEAEKFTEFELAYKEIVKTKLFEDELKKLNNSKPIIFCEGETDVLYIKKAAELLDEKELLKKIDVKWIGAYETEGKPRFTGKDSLNQAYNLFKYHPEHVGNGRLLLYDCDANKSEENIGKLIVRSLEKNSDSLVFKGIENLFKKSFLLNIRKQHSQFIDYYPEWPKEKNGKLDTQPEKYEIKDHKNDLCKHICEVGKKNDFKNFKQIFDLIKKEFADYLTQDT